MCQIKAVDKIPAVHC